MQHPLRLSDEDFAYIYGKVPRFNVDLIVRTDDDGVVLIKRAIDPHVGHWHVPGGTLYKGEKIGDAAIRIAKAETGFDVEVVKELGVMEFPEEKRGDLLIHTVSVAIEVHVTKGELKQDSNAKEIKVCYVLPTPGIPEHMAFLEEHGFLKKES